MAVAIMYRYQSEMQSLIDKIRDALVQRMAILELTQANLKLVFDDCDKDKSGTLEAKEFKIMLRCMSIEIRRK